MSTGNEVSSPTPSRRKELLWLVALLLGFFCTRGLIITSASSTSFPIDRAELNYLLAASKTPDVPLMAVFSDEDAFESVMATSRSVTDVPHPTSLPAVMGTMMGTRVLGARSRTLRIQAMLRSALELVLGLFLIRRLAGPGAALAFGILVVMGPAVRMRMEVSYWGTHDFAALIQAMLLWGFFWRGLPRPPVARALAAAATGAAATAAVIMHPTVAIASAAVVVGWFWQAGRSGAKDLPFGLLGGVTAAWTLLVPMGIWTHFWKGMSEMEWRPWGDQLGSSTLETGMQALSQALPMVPAPCHDGSLSLLSLDTRLLFVAAGIWLFRRPSAAFERTLAVMAFAATLLPAFRPGTEWLFGKGFAHHYFLIAYPLWLMVGGLALSRLLSGKSFQRALMAAALLGVPPFLSLATPEAPLRSLYFDSTCVAFAVTEEACTADSVFQGAQGGAEFISGYALSAQFGPQDHWRTRSRLPDSHRVATALQAHLEEAGPERPLRSDFAFGMGLALRHVQPERDVVEEALQGTFAPTEREAILLAWER